MFAYIDYYALWFNSVMIFLYCLKKNATYQPISSFMFRIIETREITMNENIYVYICIAVEEPNIRKGVIIPLSGLIPRHFYDASNT
jgi:hypothetical protein